jgi:hypothetical protein
MNTLIAVLNTCEQITEVLEREFDGCIIDKEKESVTIDDVLHYYYPHDVMCMPTDEVTIYEIEKI